MTDKPLTDREVGFIAAYLQSKDAAAAARAVGMPKHAGEKLVARADIAAEIERRRAAAATEPAGEVSFEALLVYAHEAVRLAKESGNPTALATSVQTLARLMGKWDGEAPELAKKEAPPVDSRDLARAIIHSMPPEDLPRFRIVLEAMVAAQAEGRVVATEKPGQTFAVVSNPDMAATIGAKLAQPLVPDKPTNPPTGPGLDGAAAPGVSSPSGGGASGATVDGVSVVFEANTASHEVDRRGRARPAGKPRTGWAVYRGSIRHGFFTEEVDALACAQALRK